MQESGDEGGTGLKRMKLTSLKVMYVHLREKGVAIKGKWSNIFNMF